MGQLNPRPPTFLFVHHWCDCFLRSSHVPNFLISASVILAIFRKDVQTDRQTDRQVDRRHLPLYPRSIPYVGVSNLFTGNICTNIQVFQNKLHKVFHLINFEPFAVDSRCLHQNVRQKLLSTERWKISINGQHVDTLTVRRHTNRSTQWPSCRQSSSLHWTTKLANLPHLNQVDYSILGAFQQLVYRHIDIDYYHFYFFL